MNITVDVVRLSRTENDAQLDLLAALTPISATITETLTGPGAASVEFDTEEVKAAADEAGTTVEELFEFGSVELHLYVSDAHFGPYGDTLAFAGPVEGLQARSGPDGQTRTVRVDAFGLSAHFDQVPTSFVLQRTYTNEQAGAIIKDLIERSQNLAYGEALITVSGDYEHGELQSHSWEPGTYVMDAIAQVVAETGSVEWWIEPDRTVRIAGERGTDRSELVEFNERNATRFEPEMVEPSVASRVYVEAPDGEQGIAEDVGLLERFGPRTVFLNASADEVPSLEQVAADELLSLREPQFEVRFEHLVRHDSPVVPDDYRVGDRVGVLWPGLFGGDAGEGRVVRRRLVWVPSVGWDAQLTCEVLREGAQPRRRRSGAPRSQERLWTPPPTFPAPPTQPLPVFDPLPTPPPGLTPPEGTPPPPGQPGFGGALLPGQVSSYNSVSSVAVVATPVGTGQMLNASGQTLVAGDYVVWGPLDTGGAAIIGVRREGPPLIPAPFELDPLTDAGFPLEVSALSPPVEFGLDSRRAVQSGSAFVDVADVLGYGAGATVVGGASSASRAVVVAPGATSTTALDNFAGDTVLLKGFDGRLFANERLPGSDGDEFRVRRWNGSSGSWDNLGSNAAARLAVSSGSLWKLAKTGGTPAALSDEFLYVGRVGNVRKWDVSDGIDEVWSQASPTVPLQGISVSRDGAAVYIAFEDNIRRLDAATGNEVWTVPLSDARSVQVSPDGRFVYANVVPRRVFAFRAESGALLWELETSGRFSPITGPLVVSPDGEHLYLWRRTGSTSSQFSRTIRKIDAATGQQVASASLDDGFENPLAISPDGKTIYAGRSGGIDVVDTTAMVFNSTLSHAGIARDLEVSPDGQHLYVAGSSGTLRRYNTGTGLLDWEFAGFSNDANAVALSPDGNHVYAGGNDNIVRKFDASNGTQLATEDLQDTIRSLAFLRPPFQRQAAQLTSGNASNFTLDGDTANPATGTGNATNGHLAVGDSIRAATPGAPWQQTVPFGGPNTIDNSGGVWHMSAGNLVRTADGQQQTWPDIFATTPSAVVLSIVWVIGNFVLLAGTVEGGDLEPSLAGLDVPIVWSFNDGTLNTVWVGDQQAAATTQDTVRTGAFGLEFLPNGEIVWLVRQHEGGSWVFLSDQFAPLSTPT